MQRIGQIMQYVTLNQISTISVRLKDMLTSYRFIKLAATIGQN